MNLFWKEFRESYPVVALALGVIFFMLLAPLLGGEDSWYGYIWGLGFHIGAMAILLFVSLVLGVTAYAVEEEQETLDPLLAKPVPSNDILAMKLGIRLGFVFLAMLILGALELATGAWPIEWNIPSPVIFQRWLGGLALCVAGLGFGFYFGKTRKHQTAALLIAVSLIAVGYVIFYLTPLRFLFEGPKGFTAINWIREILVPFAAGIAAILGSILSPEERRMRIPGAVAAGAALTFYALLIYSLTALPIQLVWQNPDTYRAYFNLRFSGPEKTLATVIERTLDEDIPETDLVGLMLRRTYIRISRQSQDTYLTLVGRRQLPIYLESYAVGPTSQAERFTAEERSPRLVTKILDLGLRGELPELDRMMGLHLAGVQNNPAHTEAIATFLQDPSVDVRTMASLVLAGRGDERGMDALVGLLPDMRPFINEDVALFMIYSALDLGPDVGWLMRRWLSLPPEQSRDDYNQYGSNNIKRRAALRWIRKYGDINDLPLARQAVWANLPDVERSETTPDQVNVWSYMRAWSEPYIEPERETAARRAALELIEELWPRREWAAEIYTAGSWNVRWSERREFFDYTGKISKLLVAVSYLIETGDPEAISIWHRAKPLLEMRAFYSRTYTFRGLTILPLLAEMGQPGLEELTRVFRDPKSPPEIRFQAALVLVNYGSRELSDDAISFWELYRNRGERFWISESIEGFLLLLEDGHAAFADPILTFANQVIRGEVRTFGYYGSSYQVSTAIIGPYFWNSRIAEALKGISGRDYGWDLKAWTRWWEREGKQLASERN